MKILGKRNSISEDSQKIHEDLYWNLVDQKDFLRKLSRNYYFKKLELKGKTEEFIFRNELGNKK
jgi:hypothetical protein